MMMAVMSELSTNHEAHPSATTDLSSMADALATGSPWPEAVAMRTSSMGNSSAGLLAVMVELECRLREEKRFHRGQCVTHPLVAITAGLHLQTDEPLNC